MKMYLDEYAAWNTPAVDSEARADKVTIFRDVLGEWRWRYVRMNGRVMADSGEGYKNRGDAVAAVEFIFRGRDEIAIEFEE